MYTYVKSVVLERSIAAQWKEAQLLNASVYSIFNEFSSVVHVLTHPDYTEPLYINFDSLKADHGGYNGTLEEWLVYIDNLTLPKLDELPTTKIRYIKYSDAVQAGYKINLAKAGSNVVPGYPRSELNDLILTRPNTTTNIPSLQYRSLISVNGYLHMTDTDNQNFWVIDGGQTAEISNHRSVGIISFDNMCDVKKIPIDQDMLFPEVTDRPLKEHIQIKLPEPIYNRSFILSIGGYIQLPEPGVCWVSNTDTISLSIDKLPHLERYQESLQYIDLSSLSVTRDPNNPTAVSTEELYSDQVLKEYLTLSQSFVILIETKQLTHRKLFIQQSNLPGMFITHQDPSYPLLTGYGRISDYWKTYEDGKWSLNVLDPKADRYVFSRRLPQETDVINGHRVPGRTYKQMTGMLLELGIYI